MEFQLFLAHSTGIGNFPSLYAVADQTNGEIVEIPYYDGISGHQQPLALRYDNTTNVFFRPASAPKLFEVIQNTGAVNIYNPNSSGLTLLNGALLSTTNGIILKANGTLLNADAFDSTDAGTVHHDAAPVYGNLFQSDRKLLLPLQPGQ